MSLSALQCIVLVCRHYNTEVTVDQLLHQYAIDDVSKIANFLPKISKGLGFKSKYKKITPAILQAARDSYPLMVELSGNEWGIVIDIYEKEEGVYVNYVDPKENSTSSVECRLHDFTKKWTGRVFFLKKKTSLLDENQHFGLRWFLPQILKYRKNFFDVFVAALFITFISLITPIFFQLVIDKVLVHEAHSTLKVLGIGISIALIFDAFLNYLRSYILLHATTRIDTNIVLKTFGHLLSLPIDFFEKASAGVLSKHMEQSSSIREFLTGSLFLTLLESITLVVFLPFLFFYSSTLTFVVIAFTSLIALLIAALIIPFRRRLHAMYQAEADRQAMLIESIQGMLTVKAMAMEPIQTKHWEKKAAKAIKMKFEVGKISITASTLSQLLEKLMTVAIVWVGAESVFNESLTVGELVAFQMLAGRVSSPLVQMVSLIHDYQETALSIRMLGNVMNTAPEPGLMRGGVRLPFEQGMGVEFDKVVFSYPNAKQPILDRFSLSIPSGKVIGIVGKSGSGKTTITRMIQGIYIPQSGVLRIGGVDIREQDIAYLRQSMGVVLQENFLFRGTVKENIAMSRPSASFDEIINVAHLSGSSEFIERLPKSFDTILEEGATNISGGQKQRLAIARALLTNPKLLILDEATSALDPESEAIVQKNLSHIAKDRTVIIVSHRLSMISKTDGILVLNEGNIEDYHKHTVLLKRCELYRTMWEQQMNPDVN